MDKTFFFSDFSSGPNGPNQRTKSAAVNITSNDAIIPQKIVDAKCQCKIKLSANNAGVERTTVAIGNKQITYHLLSHVAHSRPSESHLLPLGNKSKINIIGKAMTESIPKIALKIEAKTGTTIAEITRKTKNIQVFAAIFFAVNVVIKNYLPS